MLPRVILHNAVSLDGRIDWFPADIAKFYELASSWKEDATLAGADTLIKAYPEEKTEPEDAEAFEHEKNDANDTRPLLVIPDSRGRLRHILPLLRHEPYWRDMVILAAGKTPKSYLEYLHKRNIKHIIAGEDYVNFPRALDELNVHFGIKIIRVDSGGTLNGMLLRAGLVNEVSLLIHPNLVGGISSRSMYRAPDLITSSGVLDLKLINLEKIANDLVWLRYEVINKDGSP
jgi:2,5-diamino-6-(ribosylamino)-4(3H)-pyrimidinone 5'-phosphate reductase